MYVTSQLESHSSDSNNSVFSTSDDKKHVLMSSPFLFNFASSFFIVISESQIQLSAQLLIGTFQNLKTFMRTWSRCFMLPGKIHIIIQQFFYGHLVFI